MKKIILALTLSLSAAVVMARETKEGVNYLPEAGNFSIGVSADPLVSYMGNLFNGNTSNGIDGSTIGGDPFDASSYQYTYPTVSIVGRYMLTDKFGIRANVGILVDNEYNQGYVVDDKELAENPLSNQKVIDGQKIKQSGASLSAAAEFRVGDRRVQGVFSAGLVYAYSKQQYIYSYGNAITETNQQPSSYTSYATTASPTNSGMSYARTLSSTNNGLNSFGFLASAGVEWFFAPKVSLGLDVNLVGIYSWSKATYSICEGYNEVSGSVEEFTDLVSPKNSSFVFGTKNIGSNLAVNFYF